MSYDDAITVQKWISPVRRSLMFDIWLSIVAYNIIIDR